MIFKKFVVLILFCFPTLFVFGERRPEIPNTSYPGQIITRDYYALQYSEEYEQAIWVAYELTKKEVMGKTSRTDNYRPDPDIITGSATLNDYKNSGYDRGHLAPAADMKMTYQSMSESFLLSNISPQIPEFNRGIWRELESLVRDYAIQMDHVLVVTGPILSFPVKGYIGESKVAVPWGYFKVILGDIGGIGFMIENTESQDDVYYYATTINMVEDITMIDFFPFLPDEEEETIEEHIPDKFL